MVGLTRAEKDMVRAGLALRDHLGGHHFLQAELGAGANGVEKQGWICRDCHRRATVDQRAWHQWMVFWTETPENVRRILDKRSC